MNSQTAYRSPISFLSLTAEESAAFPEALLQEAKNRLYRDDAETATAALLQQVSAATWPFHKTIYEQKGLLQFLEEGVFNEEALSKASPLRYHPAFVQFISLPFAHSFCLAAKEALAKEDEFATIDQLMQYASFVLPEHQAIAFASINAYLHALTLKLEPLSWEQFVQDESLLNFLFSPRWILFFNPLPSLCDEGRQALTGSILQLLKRFRLDASEQYLKAVCGKLQQLKMIAGQQQELREYKQSFILQKAPAPPPAKAPRAAFPYIIAGGILMTGLLLFFLLRPKDKRPPQAEDKYMDAVESVSIPNQLNSSINERNLKAFFYLSSRQENNGTSIQLQTGQSPIPGITRLPAQDGNSTMIIRNETSSDALLLYFGSDNPLLTKQSQLVAVYIKKGDTYRLRFQPDFGRFNFLFGNGWVELDSPVPFPFYQDKSTAVFPSASPEAMDDYWLINRFFRQVRPVQPFLNHDITITNIEQKTEASSAAPAFTLLNEKKGKKLYSDPGAVELSLQENEGQISLKAFSSLYVYKSPPTFDPLAL